MSYHRFIGLSLSGGKADKACLAVLEYDSKLKKVYLVKIYEKIKNTPEASADLQIYELIEKHQENLVSLAMDAPLTIPVCMRCQLECPGYETCGEAEIKWFRVNAHKKSLKKNPKKFFTPYTQRAVEFYLSMELEEKFILENALGANDAPLTARAHFIQRRIPFANCLEVFPELSVWRIGRDFGIGKAHLRFHRHAVGGEESREVIIKKLSEKNVAFMYQQDVNMMIDNNHAFYAFICALTAYLKFVGQTEKRPASFPKSEGWIDFPIQRISW